MTKDLSDSSSFSSANNTQDEVTSNAEKGATKSPNPQEQSGVLAAQEALISENETKLNQLVLQTHQIQEELVKLNNHKLVHTYNSIPRFLWFSLLKGIAVGLGSVLGATVVLSTLVYILSQMEFIPIIGEWISAILEVVDTDAEN